MTNLIRISFETPGTVEQGLGESYVHTIPDNFCVASKIIQDRASVDTQERLWRHNFCDQGRLRRADLESVERQSYRIGFVPCFGAV